ncbi:MAG TPA: neutral/alkaline non-lysosomal ceramidase N-terminal domain-containing protein [Spirochaetota bacterium]|nr:neutral/alkaline non-lysosomal ceramidase N-terminal domain-containing protein [Spirochaetota bacterium]
MMKIKGCCLTILFLAIGCTTLRPVTITVNNPAPLKAKDVSTLMAGAARADITPPPGLPLAGHSLQGERSIGVRTRLYARVIYLKPGSGKPLALVQVDLLSGSRILHHRVAELIASKTDVEAGGLVIAGTHTHSAQGNYFGDAFYDRMASPKPGFEEKLLNFMADQIAGAVVRACENRRPAKIATGSIDITGVIRNRSLPAYHMNKSLGGKKPNEREAVNPELRMIRVDCRKPDGSWAPIGAFSNFSLHPNLGNDDTDMLYNGDVTAFAERVVERGIARRYPSAVDPVHALANLTHGDITPDYGEKEKLGYQAMRRIGTMIGDRAMELFMSLEKGLTADAVIRYRAEEIDVYRDRCLENDCLCEKPAVGEATLGGGRDRPVKALNWLPGIAPGWPRKNPGNDCQGAKRVAAKAIQHKIYPLDEYPHVLFIQALQVHDTVLLPLPFEVTTEAGRQIAGRCREAGRMAGLPDSYRYTVMDTSNGYWGYCATKDEYSLQYYEGGSTLYGPGTADYLAARMSRLVEELPKGSGGTLPTAWSFVVKVAKSYYPTGGEPAGMRTIEENPEFKDRSGGGGESYWTFRWRDVPPSLISLHEPLVSVEVSDDGSAWRPLVVYGVPADDGGSDIAVICRKPKASQGMAVYEVRWYNPVREKGRFYRFVILPRPGQAVLYSPAF